LQWSICQRLLVAQLDHVGLSGSHAVQLIQGCNVHLVAALAVLELCQAAAEPLKSWTDHAQARLTLLAIQTVDANFDLALTVRAEDKSVALVSLHHVGELGCEDVVAAVFALFLACHGIDVLDWQVLVQLI